MGYRRRDFRVLTGGMSGLGGFGVGDDQAPVQIDGIPNPILPIPLAASSVQQFSIPDGIQGTEATMNAMAQVAIQGAADPWMIQEAQGIVSQCAPRDKLCEAAAVLQAVDEGTDYRGDSMSPLLTDVISSPGWVWVLSGAEDCDSLAALIACFIMAAGVGGVLFRAVALDSANPGVYTHVYAVALIRTSDGQGIQEVALDSVHQPATPGWEPDPSEMTAPPLDVVVAMP